MASEIPERPPVQYLILETLAARHRLGDRFWTFPSRLRPHLAALAVAGLVSYQSGVAQGTLRASLTDEGRGAALGEGYESPAFAAGVQAGRDHERQKIAAEFTRHTASVEAGFNREHPAPQWDAGWQAGIDHATKFLNGGS